MYKIEIDLDEMVKWCKNQKQPLDSTARAEFVSMKVKEVHESQSKKQQDKKHINRWHYMTEIALTSAKATVNRFQAVYHYSKTER